jgi:hypothetical protein
MPYALYAIAATEALGALLTVALIGKPRKPLTPVDAITRIIIGGAVAALLCVAALGMH